MQLIYFQLERHRRCLSKNRAVDLLAVDHRATDSKTDYKQIKKSTQYTELGTVSLHTRQNQKKNKKTTQIPYEPRLVRAKA